MKTDADIIDTKVRNVGLYLNQLVLKGPTNWVNWYSCTTSRKWG